MSSLGLKKEQKIIKQNSGIYLLEVKAPAPFFIKSKKFFQNKFSRGYYYYSGSAQKNLYQRINRHLKKNKIIHWHIDHITVLPSIQIKNVFIVEGGCKSLECELINTLLNEFNLKIAAAGFGNGDCGSCASHLLFSKNKIDHNHLLSRYQSMVCLIPSSKFIC